MSMRRPGLLPSVPLWRVLLRAVRWFVAAMAMLAGVLWDKLRGKTGQSQLGRRVRQLFEHVGGTAIKLGQQLSVRVDILPPELCEQLESLSDRVPPMPEAHAKVLLAQGLGQPVADVFSAVNWVAIGSGSVACVYEAWLHSGTRVAVKLRRAGIAQAFAADLDVFEWCTRFAQFIGVLREGLLLHLWVDLRLMLGEETSLTLEARYQRVFQNELKRSLMPWISAPRVYSQWCTDSVLVTEFVEGLRFTEVLTAVESGSVEGLKALAARGIDSHELSVRLAQFSLWVRFESTFFHADPHPGNVFVLPGNRLVLIDFGGCGATSRQTRAHHVEVLRQLRRADASAISGVMAADLSPLPWLDLTEFRGAIENRFRPLLLAMRDANAPWFERIAASVWLRMLESARDFGIRINLDSIRSIRAFLLYDTLVARLNPSFDSEAMIERYIKESAGRTVEVLSERSALVGQNPFDLMLQEGALLVSRGEALAEFEPVVRGVLTGYRRLREVATAFGSTLLRILFVLALATASVGALRLLGLSFAVFQSPSLILFSSVVLAVWFGRRALYVLDTAYAQEPNRRR